MRTWKSAARFVLAVWLVWLWVMLRPALAAADGKTWDEPVAPPVCNMQVSALVASADGKHAYRAEYQPSTWGGTFKKYAIDKLVFGEAGPSAEPVWDAAALLTGAGEGSASPPWREREIYLGRHHAGRLFSMVEFRWDSLTTLQKGALNLVPGEKRDSLGEHRLNYLRGERAREVSQPRGVFRKRESILGDIVHSTPVEVGGPPPMLSGASYLTHREKYRTRKRAIYVGANDGMLHAFDADTGRELFAYVPDALLAQLSRLPQPGYRHHAYVDGGITAAEAFSLGTWRTVLAVSMRGGAPGLFALDITSPENFGEGGALWEFTIEDDADIGYLAGKPLIAKFRTGGDALRPEYGYFVVVTSGPASQTATGSSADGSVFLLSLDKSRTVRWKEGVNYFKFRIPSARNAGSGLSTPAILLDTANAVRHLYAGDAFGRIWHLDFRPNLPLRAAKPVTGAVFQASDPDGNPQPVTMQPRVVFAEGGYQVLFGTGRHTANSDAAPDAFHVQSLYGIRHRVDKPQSTRSRRELTVLRLQPMEEGFQLTDDNVDRAANLAGDEGWVIDLPGSADSGERALMTPDLTDGLVAFRSFVPRRSPCVQDGGRWYLINALSGRPATAVIGTPLPNGAVFSPMLNLSGVTVAPPDAFGRSVVRRQYDIVDPFAVGAGTGEQTKTVETSAQAGRLGWREIINWQELRDAAKANQASSK